MTVYLTVTPDFDLDVWARDNAHLATDENFALIRPLVEVGLALLPVIPTGAHVEIQAHANEGWAPGNGEVSDAWAMLRVTQQFPAPAADAAPEAEVPGPAAGLDPGEVIGDAGPELLGDGTGRALPPIEDGDVTEELVAEAQKPKPKAKPAAAKKD